MADDGTGQRALLTSYLNDHLMGSSAGVDLFNRVAGSYSDTGARAELRALADEVAEDRDSLLVVMGDLGIRPRIHRMLAGRLAEKVGRLKPNGTLWHRSPLTDLVELEALRVGVEGKLAMWQALAEGLEGSSLDHAEFEGLIERATAQHKRLESMRSDAARRAFVA